MGGRRLLCSGLSTGFRKCIFVSSLKALAVAGLVRAGQLGGWEVGIVVFCIACGSVG